MRERKEGRRREGGREGIRCERPVSMNFSLLIFLPFSLSGSTVSYSLRNGDCLFLFCPYFSLIDNLSVIVMIAVCRKRNKKSSSPQTSEAT